MEKQPSSANGRLFSIGHSNHELRRLVELLQRAGVAVVADVRSQPFSRWLPQFNRPELTRGLRQFGIDYVFLGDFLGGRPSEPGVYDVERRVDYEQVRATAAFQQGLNQLLEVLERCTVAMLCSEEDPLDCHRSLMIAPALAERGITTGHLRGDGSVESTPALEQRLLAETGVGAGILDGLFAFDVTEEERRVFLMEAYRVMTSRKAFRLQPGADDPQFLV